MLFVFLFCLSKCWLSLNVVINSLEQKEQTQKQTHTKDPAEANEHVLKQSAIIHSLVLQAEHSHLIRCHGNGLGNRRVVNGLKVTTDLVTLGSNGQQTGVILDVPHLRTT